MIYNKVTKTDRLILYTNYFGTINIVINEIPCNTENIAIKKIEECLMRLVRVD